MLSELDCPKDNPTQSKLPYSRPAGWNPLRRQWATSGGRFDSSPALQRRARWREAEPGWPILSRSLRKGWTAAAHGNPRFH
jgi:hypothetical protein